MFQVHNNYGDNDNKNACLSLDPQSVKFGSIYKLKHLYEPTEATYLINYQVELRSQTAHKFSTGFFAETMNFKWALQIIYGKGILNSDL